MTQSRLDPRTAIDESVTTPRSPFLHRLREISMFFDGTDRVHQTMRRIVSEFDKLGITYAIVGGMAVNAHRHERTTKDVDFLLTADDFIAMQQRIDEIN